LLNDYDNWCPEIYRGIFIDRINDNKIRVAPCCQADSAVELIETFDFDTSPHLTKLRQQFNNGDRPAACNRCWNAETVGHKSRRQGAIEFFNIPQPTTEVVLEGLDHSATWACNLACIMCGPTYSSLWATQNNLNKDQLAKIGRQFQRSNNFLEKLDIRQIKKIHFNGGEPMLNNDQTELLLKLEEQDVLKNTFISYNTNGTVMPSKQIINLWSKARLVKLFFSIDAVDSAFEYIRWPGKWEETSNNILNMKSSLPNNVMFGINSTVGSYNVLEMGKVYNWFDQNLRYNREGDRSDFCWQFANNFDPKHLSSIIKMQAIAQLKSITELSGIVNYLKSTIDQPEDLSWVTQLNDIDSKRNTNWKTALKISQFIKDANC
jgi:MoaA/NifB/PqqE/SkfB family radical SAM enzyme